MNRYDAVTLDLLSAFALLDFRKQDSLKHVASSFFNDDEVSQVFQSLYTPDQVYSFVRLVLEAIGLPEQRVAHRWRFQNVCHSKHPLSKLEAAVREHYGRLEHHIDRFYEWNPNKQGPVTLMPGATFQTVLGYLSSSSAFGPTFWQTAHELEQIFELAFQEHQAIFRGKLPLSPNNNASIYTEVTLTNGVPPENPCISPHITSIGKQIHAHLYARCDKPHDAYRF